MLQYFSKIGDTSLISGIILCMFSANEKWCNNVMSSNKLLERIDRMIHKSCLAVATWCFALSCLVLACLTKQKPFTYMLLNISNTSCNWLAQFSRWILYICTMWCGYSYLLKKWYLDIYKKYRWNKTRQGKTKHVNGTQHPDMEVSFGFNKLHKHSLPFVKQFHVYCYYPDSKVHGANMGPSWVLLAPDGPHVDPMNLAIRVCIVKWNLQHDPT